MSFARNFAAGQQIAKGLVDTYQTAKRNSEIAAIMDEKPQEAFTPDGIKAIQEAEAAGDSFGINYKPDGTFDSYKVTKAGGLKPQGEFNAEPDPGSFKPQGEFKPVDEKPVEPKNIGFGLTQFQGKDYEGKLTDKQIYRMKESKLADLEMRDDPVKGMRLKRSLDDANRAEDKRDRDEADEKVQLETQRKFISATPAEQDEMLKNADPKAWRGLIALAGDKETLATARTAAAAKEVSGLILNENWSGVEKAYKAFPDGIDATIVKNADGTITVNRSKNGEPLEPLQFKDKFEMGVAVLGAYDPTGQIKSVQAQRQKVAEAQAAFNADVLKAGAVEAAKMAARAPYAKTGPGGSSGSTSSTKPPPTQMSEILEIFKEQTGDDQKPLRVQAAATAEAMLALNQSPGSTPIPSSVIAYGALQAASNPASITPKLNKKTLKWENTVNVQGRDIVVDRNVPKEVQEKLMPVRADELFTEMLSANPEFAKAALGDVASRTSFLSKEEQRIAQQLAKQSGLNVTDSKVWAQAKKIVAEQAAPSLDSYGSLFANSERAKMMFKQMNATKNTKQNMPGVLGWFN